MYTRIVVGTDGSDSAASAVELAASLARDTGAELHIVNAFRATTGAGQVSAIGGGAPADPALGQAVASVASQQLLDGIAADLPGIVVSTHSINDAPAEAVLGVATSVDADLIVVGSKGMQRRVLGSVPNSIAHKAPCDLLIAKTT